MQNLKESPPIQKDNEELADTLTAISVVAKQLATKIREKEDEEEEKNEDHSRN